MELNIEGTKTNPEIFFDKIGNKVIIEGRSVLKNMDDEFFHPLYSFLDNYSNSGYSSLTLVLNLDYFNTSTHPSLITIFRKMNSISEAKIIWLYERNDMEMMEIGQELQMYSPIKFEIRHIEIV